ncbi:MAG TPA: prolyl oligopeptidase family serine peptidase, partial [Gemmataceae bacterium]|nr:prolyl oligopeptidase family serine peptidase [Gemmataceae bacterium]
EAYLTPPKEIADAVLASRHENATLTNLSPDGKKFLITKSDGLPPLARMARPCVHLGEMEFDPGAGRSRELWIRSSVGFDIYHYADKRTLPVQIPERARVSNPLWSPDGSKVAFFAHLEEATHIYLADTETGFSRRLTLTPVLATLVTTFQWSKDGKQIQTVLLPDEGKREIPKPNGVAAEPKVRIARGGNKPSRTYRYLLESPYDMKLLEHLATGQLALIDINDGKVTKIGFPNLIRNVSMAPGEGQFRITLLKKPFSYFVPLTRFGSQEEICNLEGKCLLTLADRNIRDTEPQPAAPTALPAGQRRTAGQPRTQAPAQPPDPGQPQPDPDPDPDSPRRDAPPVDPDAKRDIGWRPDGAGLSFLQLEPALAKEPVPVFSATALGLLAATPGKGHFLVAAALISGRSSKDANEPRKDRVYQWLPPYGKDNVKVLYETPRRISSLQYSDDCRMLFLTQTIDNQRQISAVDLSDPKKTTYVIHKSAARGGNDANRPVADPDPPADDRAEDGSEEEQPPVRGRGLGAGTGMLPGLLTRSKGAGVKVALISSTGDVYITGADRSPGGGFPRPTIDKINIKTGKKARIFEGKGDMLETIDAVNGDDIKLVFTTRQKLDVVPDSFLNDLQTGNVTKLTNNVNHTPWYNQLPVQRFQVTRIDGFKFRVKVTTPAKPEGKLPALFWIYPREYADQAAYNRASARNAANSNRFAAPGPRSMTLLTLQGYAVVEPDIPIVGPAGRMNDNYVPDLRNSLWAVIDELDKKGIIDRDRLAVGGHSYGAFSTANALAHTPFFKAGIAGDGNYNRTLTTMTFQTERRNIWDARETYLEMSPLLWANRVNGALLLYHGMNDANVGTNPINAEHMFLALDGLGKPAALFMYPYEGHGPLAKETTLDLWARWTAWLDTYVKNPPKKKT